MSDTDTVIVMLPRVDAERYAACRTSCTCDSCWRTREAVRVTVLTALDAPRATNATLDHASVLESALREIVALCSKATYTDDIHEVAGIARRALEGDAERTLAKTTRARALLADIDEARSTLATTTDLFAGMRAEGILQEAPRRALALLREMYEIEDEPVACLEEVNHGK